VWETSRETTAVVVIVGGKRTFLFRTKKERGTDRADYYVREISREGRPSVSLRKQIVTPKTAAENIKVSPVTGMLFLL